MYKYNYTSHFPTVLALNVSDNINGGNLASKCSLSDHVYRGSKNDFSLYYLQFSVSKISSILIIFLRLNPIVSDNSFSFIKLNGVISILVCSTCV